MSDIKIVTGPLYMKTTDGDKFVEVASTGELNYEIEHDQIDAFEPIPDTLSNTVTFTIDGDWIIPRMIDTFWNSDNPAYILARKNRRCRKTMKMIEHNFYKQKRLKNKMNRKYFTVKKGKRLIKVIV